MNQDIDLLAIAGVGTTFLLSGVAKLNDPRGFAYKIEEYLHLLVSQLTARIRLLVPYTLALAIGIATLEVVLGVAMLVRWQYFWTLWTLLLLTFFFTLLTLYTALSRRMASCGCFGDALVLTPWQSFLKSVVLLCILGGLCWQANDVPTGLNSHYGMVVALLSSLGLSRYTLKHLPLLDFLPYGIESDLKELVQLRLPFRYGDMAARSKVQESRYHPKVSSWQFMSVLSFTHQETYAANPLSIWQGKKKCTPTLLTGHKLLIISQYPATLTTRTLQNLYALIRSLKKALQPILLVPSNQEKEAAKTLALPIYTAHPLLLRTMLRAELGLLLLSDGIVVNKWNFNDLKQVRKTLNRMDLLSRVSIARLL